MPAPKSVPFSQVVWGTFELVRRRAYPVAIGTLFFALVCASASGYVQRKTDGIQEELSKALGISREETVQKINKQLLELGSLEFIEFARLMQSRIGEPMIAADTPDPDSSQLGIAYVVKAAPYLFIEYGVDLVTFFIAGIFFFLLFTHGSSGAYDMVRLLPLSILKTLGYCALCILHPVYIASIFGPSVGLVILLSEEHGIRGSIRAGITRTFVKPFSVILCGIGIIMMAFLVFWPLAVVSAAAALFSFKFGAFLILCSFVFAIVVLTAAFTMLAAILA